jgi:beta-lactamase class A
MVSPATDAITPTPSLPITEPGTASFPAQELQAILDDAGGIVGAVVYDATSGQSLYTQNANHSFYAASLMKLPIAFTVYDMARRGTLPSTESQTSIEEPIPPAGEPLTPETVPSASPGDPLDRQLIMEVQDIVPGTGILRNDPPGTAYTLRQLCYVTIAHSDNTASNMLLDFIAGDPINPQHNPVNELMSSIGATQTTVERRFFDDEARLAGRDIRTTPADMAMLLQELLRRYDQGDSDAAVLLDAMRQNVDDTKISAFLSPDTIVMNKSGVVEGMEHDMAIVTLPTDRRYIVVFMSDELPSNHAGVSAIARASELIFEYERGR